MRCWDRSSGSERSRRPHRRKINPGPPAQRFIRPPLSRYIALAQRRTMALMSRRGPLLERKRKIGPRRHVAPAHLHILLDEIGPRAEAAHADVLAERAARGDGACVGVVHFLVGVL